MTNLKTSVALLLMLTVAGCKVGPNYKRPVVNAPDAYRGLAPELAPQTAASIGDEKWFTVFHDEQLEKLIREALTQNYDVRIAATRVLQAQAALGITRADQFPTVSGGAGVSASARTSVGASPAKTSGGTTRTGAGASGNLCPATPARNPVTTSTVMLMAG